MNQFWKIQPSLPVVDSSSSSKTPPLLSIDTILASPVAGRHSRLTQPSGSDSTAVSSSDAARRPPPLGRGAYIAVAASCLRLLPHSDPVHRHIGIDRDR